MANFVDQIAVCIRNFFKRDGNSAILKIIERCVSDNLELPKRACLTSVAVVITIKVNNKIQNPIVHIAQPFRCLCLLIT